MIEILFSAAAPSEQKALMGYLRKGRSLIGPAFVVSLRAFDVMVAGRRHVWPSRSNIQAGDEHGPVEVLQPGTLAVTWASGAGFSLLNGRMWLSVAPYQRTRPTWAVLPIMEAARRLTTAPSVVDGRLPAYAGQHSSGWLMDCFATARRVDPEAAEVALDLLRERAPHLLKWPTSNAQRRAR